MLLTPVSKGLPLSHTNSGDLINVGSNTHSQIDTHIALSNLNAHGATATADLNIAGYKLIAATCDNGTSFPTTPASNRPQYFYRTDIYTLFIYEGAWKAIISFGAVSLYVDPALGSDAVGKGYASGSGATATRQYAVDLLPPINGGNVTITIAAGTYTDAAAIIQGKAFSGAYTITFVGSMTTQDTGTATSGAAFTGGAAAHTKATLTNTAKAYTVNVHANRLLVITGGTGSGQERFIYSNTATVLTIAGDWDTVPDATSTYAIKTFDTIIDCNDTRSYAFKQDNQKGIIYKYIKTLNGRDYDYFFANNSYSEIYSCYCDDTVVGQTLKASVQALNSVCLVKTLKIEFASTSINCFGLYWTAGSLTLLADHAEQMWIKKGYIGIAADSFSVLRFRYSLIENSGLCGVYAESAIVQIANPANTVVSNASSYGIYCTAKSFVFVQTGCEISSCGSHGIYIDAQSMLRRNNAMYVANNGGWGVYTAVQSHGKNVSLITYSGNTSGTYTADATSLNT